MKKIYFNIFFSLGWILLFVFLLSGYFFNKFSMNPENTSFNPILWENHVQMFNGVIQCNLIEEDLMERKKLLKEQIFSKVLKKQEKHNGIVYYFNDDDLLLTNALEFIKFEKECCPFFKFDISILPFDAGFAIQISGSQEAFDLLKDFDKNEF